MGIMSKLLNIALDRPLPHPSSEEKIFVSELQTAFREFSVLETTNVLQSEAMWLSNMNQLREFVLSRDPREFLQWDVVSRTMFLSFAWFTSKELKYLKHRPDWNTRWRSAIKESLVGHPSPYIFYPSSSANLIHHAYHVAQFEEKTKIQVQNMDYVFEFGGGYGSMCRLFYKLGFRGKYVIFDLPAFSLLQRYYLRTLGFPVRSAAELVQTKTGIACVSDIQHLVPLLTNHLKPKHSMFIATWSLSESPINIRESILPLTSEFESFLIAYQDRFGEVNNTDYFDNWKETTKNVVWHSWGIEHIPGSSYLVGRVVDNW